MLFRSPSCQEKVAAKEPGAGSIDQFRGSGVILIVDDEQTIRDVTRRMLEKFGFSVLTADDGSHGVEVFREAAQDVAAVLLDMTMPNMSGAEAFHAIRAIHPTVPILLTSGFSEQEATHQFGGADLAGFIQKPYRPAELLQKIKGIIAAPQASAAVRG